MVIIQIAFMELIILNMMISKVS